MRIDYTHPNYHRIQEWVSVRFNNEFNQIPLGLVEKAYLELEEFIIYPETYEDEEPLYPMWGTVFEASSSFVSDKLLQHTDQLAELGIYLMNGFEELNACCFIAGAGYDFYEAHWIPMMQLFGWIPDDLLEVPDEGTSPHD